MKSAGPQHIKSVINHIFGNPNSCLTQEHNKIAVAWEKAVSKKILAHTKLTSVRKDKLVVSVDSSSWLYQLNLEREKISSKLNKLLGLGGSLKIYFRSGEI